MSLGGSEQAIVNLVNNWVKMGKKVAVYGEVPEIKFNGVDYIDWKKFRYEDEHNVVILWRLYGLWCAAPFKFNANGEVGDDENNLDKSVTKSNLNQSQLNMSSNNINNPSTFISNSNYEMEERKI